MKKIKHPKQKQTVLLQSDNSQLELNWIYHKKLIRLDNDYIINNLWGEKRKILKQAR